jgi:hypothetical protein
LIELDFKKESDYKKIVQIIEKNGFSVKENNQNNSKQKLDSSTNLL